jgi:transposase
MSDKDISRTSTGYVPSGKAMPDGRRNFRMSDKKRIVEETQAPGASVLGIARRYGISQPLLFRLKREFAPPPPEPVFLRVILSIAPDQIDTVSPPMPERNVGPVIVERSSQEIEIELVGGRRVRFSRDVEPETVRAMVTLLEGSEP